MKKLFLILLSLCLTTSVFAATTVTSRTSQIGGAIVVTVDVVADGAAGAVSEEQILLRSSNIPHYLYFVEDVPGTGAATPAAYTIKLTDSDGGVVLNTTSMSETTKDFIDASKDLPNYWPMIGDLYLDVSDIGASATTKLKLIFVK